MINMNLEKRLKKIIIDAFNLKKQQIDFNWSSNDIAGWDSLGHLKLIMKIQKEFNITIEIEEMFQIKNLKDIYNIIKRKID